MLQDTKTRHKEELEAAEAASRGGDEGGDSCEGGGREAVGAEEATKGLGGMSLEDKENEEREKRDQKRAKAQRKRNKQREKARSLHPLDSACWRGNPAEIIQGIPRVTGTPRVKPVL